MSACMWFLNRCVAPFFFGAFMAAGAHADGLINALPFVACAGVFAFLSFELGSRIKGRIAHTPA